MLGESVAAGYVGRVDSDSFIQYEGKRAYLTGDLGYLKGDVLYYHARKDSQIKWKGYRMELSDIEKNLQDFDYVEKVAVIPKKSEEGKVMQLLAFVKLKENACEKEQEIREDLLTKVPFYMCPKIVIVERFLVNKNGKCDKKKLLEEWENGR